MQLTLSTAPRKGRSPLVRSAEFEQTAPGRGQLSITVGAITSVYNLSEIGSEFGGRGFQLDKHGDGRETYHVHVGGDNASTTCDCIGFEHRRICKQVEVLRALLAFDGFPPSRLANPCQCCHAHERELPSSLCVGCQLDVNESVLAMDHRCRGDRAAEATGRAA